MYFRLLCIAIFSIFLSVHEVKAQNKVKKTYLLKSKVISGDTIAHVNLRELTVMPPFHFKSRGQYRRYSRLMYNIKKTLPYARIVKQKLLFIAQVTDTIKSNKEKKRYLKIEEKELFKEFEKPLKRLTYSQGRMLIKLIDRETGSSAYSLIKELKGGFSAFMWQSVARIFGSNLKSEYEKAGDDAMIEYIICQIDAGLL